MDFTPIKTFDKETLKVLREAMQWALDSCNVEGVDFKVGRMSFTANEVSIKVEAKTKGAAEDTTKLVAKMAKYHGLASTERNGWKIVDYHSAKRKFPFIIRNESGTLYKNSVSQALTKFGQVAV